jgi:hypothetical protein
MLTQTSHHKIVLYVGYAVAHSELGVTLGVVFIMCVHKGGELRQYFQNLTSADD